MVGEDKLRRDLAAANERLKRAQNELERARQQSRATDLPRHSPSKYNKYVLCIRLQFYNMRRSALNR